MQTRIAAILLIAFSLIGATTVESAWAHEFTSDESSAFLALVESIKVELDLVNSSFLTNVTSATEHAAHAHEHLDEHTVEEIAERNERLGTDLPAALERLNMSVGNSTSDQVADNIQEIRDLLDETVSVRIESNQKTNSTTMAVVVATLVDGSLEHYKLAYGIGTENGGHDDDHDSGNTTSMDGHGMEMDGISTGMNGSTVIVNMVSYETAQGLAERARAVFNEDARILAPANATEALAAASAGLDELSQSISARAPPTDIELIVHGNIHPNLQQAFNLQVIPEFPAPLIAGMAAFAGIVAAARLRHLRA